METLKLNNDLYYVGVKDRDLKYFDIIVRTDYGTTYNSYILKANKTVLFETVKEEFFDEFVENVKDIIDIEKIDYVIVDHSEPDHAGSLERLIKLNPNICLVGGTSAMMFVKNMIEVPFKSITVKDNETLDLGNKTLRFISAPNLHWPDTIFTYIEEDNVLITCDAFGCHYSFDKLKRSEVSDIEGYNDAFKVYFDSIILPFAFPYVTNAVDKIKDLKIDLICTGHGPILDSDIDYVIDCYKKWSVKKVNEKPKVVVAYVSSYGYTRLLSEYIVKGLNDSGAEVVVYDVVNNDTSNLYKDIYECDGLLLGTPTMVGQALKPIMELTLDLFTPLVKDKCASSFGSYGWSGEGVPNMINRLNELKFKTMDGLKCRFRPFEEDKNAAYKFGSDFYNFIKNK